MRMVLDTTDGARGAADMTGSLLDGAPAENEIENLVDFEQVESAGTAGAKREAGRGERGARSGKCGVGNGKRGRDCGDGGHGWGEFLGLRVQ
jgi:hypothetical protein